MKVRIISLFLLLALPVCILAQNVIFSEPFREDGREMNFEVLGKLKGNILIFKNVRWKYAINVYDDSMQLKEKVDLDFIPNKTINVDYVVYPNFFYLIYQFQKKGILYCMGVKMGVDGKKLNEPVELDTTNIGLLGDNKIYSTIYSEDKKRIMVFKIQKRDEFANFSTLLFNSDLQLQHRSELQMEYNDRMDAYSDFFVDNEGTFVFSNAVKSNGRDNPSSITLVTKKADSDSFGIKRLPFEKVYVDEIKMKVDNVNKKYILSTMYYTERRGDVAGMYIYIWDAQLDTTHASVFTALSDELKSVAKSGGSYKTAFNEFFIRGLLLKRDGSFLVTAEDFSSQSSNFNNFNRFDYLYGSPFYGPGNYYLYNPAYGGYYRPFNSFSNPGIRYYYDNVLVMAVSKDGMPQWTNIIHKQQFSDDNDNYLSFNTFITPGEIHFLFNDISRRDKLLSDNIITPDGTVKRAPTVRTYEKGYEFMPRFAKQIGARQVIIPSTYRGLICFAKVDF